MASSDELFRQGMALFQAGNLPAAEAAFRKLARRERRHPLVLGVFGAILVALKKYADAEPVLREAVRLNQASHPALYNLGLALKALGRPDEALACFSDALAVNAADADTWNNRGTVRNDLKDHAGALADFDRALALNPRDALAHHNKGNALAASPPRRGRRRLPRGLALAPRFVEGWIGLGNALHKLKRHTEAADAFRAARAVAPHHPFLKGLVLHQQMLVCDWRGVDDLIAEIDADNAAGRPVAEPFGWQGVAASNRSLQRCAELYNAIKFPARVVKRTTTTTRGDIIRIGYVSGEFREQATALLMAGVFEHHDRARFEIHGFDNGWDDGGGLRRRIDAAMHRLTPIRALTDAQADAAIRDAGIDILVNLNGYFREDHTALFARRPAPVQVNYLGFPGTLGAPYIDYIVADRIVIPPDERGCFTERGHAARVLPGQQPRRAGPAPRRRATRGPAGGRLRVLLLSTTPTDRAGAFAADAHSRRGAGQRAWLCGQRGRAANCDGGRRARHARALGSRRARRCPTISRATPARSVLDTLPYKRPHHRERALWAGLPLLTWRARPSPAASPRACSPMSASRSRRVSPDDNARAPCAGHDPQALAALRARLEANRLTTPLFDTARFTRQLERAFEAMHARRREGLAPDHLAVAAE